MKRILTAAAAIPAALAVTLYAPPWLFALLIGVVAALMLEEFFDLAAAKGRSRPGHWFLIPGAAVAVSFTADPLWIVGALVVSLLCLLSASVFGCDLDRVFDRVSPGLSGVVYCSLLFGFIVLLSRDALLTVFAIIWVGDSAAYYGGRAFGRHLLAPK